MIISQVVLKEVAEVVGKEGEEHVVDEVVEEEEDIKMIEEANNISQNKVGKTLPHLTLVSVLHLQTIIVTQQSQLSKFKSKKTLSSISNLKL